MTTEITDATFDRLAAKLDQLSLADDERAVLVSLLGVVPTDDEVEGFGWDEGVAAGRVVVPTPGFTDSVRTAREIMASGGSLGISGADLRLKAGFGPSNSDHVE